MSRRINSPAFCVCLGHQSLHLPYTLGVRGANVDQPWLRGLFGKKWGVRREKQASKGFKGCPYTYYAFLDYKPPVVS